MADIYLSYTSDDLKEASQIAEALSSVGFSVFFEHAVDGSDAIRGPQGGGSYADFLQRALAESKLVIGVWSPAALEDRMVQRACMFADDRQKLLPVFVKSAIPRTDLPAVFYDTSPFDLTSAIKDRRIESWDAFLGMIKNRMGAPTISETRAHAQPIKTPPAPRTGPSTRTRLPDFVTSRLRSISALIVLALIAGSFGLIDWSGRSSCGTSIVADLFDPSVDVIRAGGVSQRLAECTRSESAYFIPSNVFLAIRDIALDEQSLDDPSVRQELEQLVSGLIGNNQAQALESLDVSLNEDVQTNDSAELRSLKQEISDIPVKLEFLSFERIFESDDLRSIDVEIKKCMPYNAPDTCVDFELDSEGRAELKDETYFRLFISNTRSGHLLVFDRLENHRLNLIFPSEFVSIEPYNLLKPGRNLVIPDSELELFQASILDEARDQEIGRILVVGVPAEFGQLYDIDRILEILQSKAKSDGSISADDLNALGDTWADNVEAYPEKWSFASVDYVLKPLGNRTRSEDAP